MQVECREDRFLGRGINHFHRSAFDHPRATSSTAVMVQAHYECNTLLASREQLRRYRWKSGLGSHLYDRRSQTFFFASREGLRLTQPTAATI